MNIIVPLAYLPKFDSNQYYYPQPLLEVMGYPLIKYFVDNINQIEGEKKFIYILSRKDCKKYKIDSVLKLLTPDCEIITLEELPKGAVCSILMAIDKIDKSEETIVVNSDQYFDLDLNKILKSFATKKVDAGVITFNAVHPRWSFVLTENNKVIQAVEKTPISKDAIAGFYYFKSFKLFIQGALNAIESEDFLNDKLYTSSVLNQLIIMNKNIENIEIESIKYFSFYTPTKIKEFEQRLNMLNK